MANIITTVRQEIALLQKAIVKQHDTLQELKRGLEIHEKIAEMLDDRTPRKSTKRPPAKKTKKKTARMNWNSVLEGLPASFTPSQVKVASGASSTYADVHQALLRWRKAGRVRTTEKGRYRKMRGAGK